MKRSLLLSLAAAAVLCLAFAGCTSAKAPAKADLLHRNFELVSVDGKPFESSMPRKPNLEFNEGFRISGGICNRFTGQAELDGNTLTAKQMASTKMLCVDEALNRLEGTFAEMLREGATIDLSDKTLTLRQGGHTLVYTLRDWVQ